MMKIAVLLLLFLCGFMSVSSFAPSSSRPTKTTALPATTELEKIGNRLLPSNWFKDEETLEAEIERRHHRRAIEKEAKQAFRGAPFPFRMIGNAVASQVGKTVRREGRKLDRVLNQAQRLIQADDRAVAELGAPVVVGTEFSHSSSATTINGKRTQRDAVGFEVLGSRRAGVGSLLAEKKKIVALKVTVEGRSFVIDV